jgi:hypothetical protein
LLVAKVRGHLAVCFHEEIVHALTRFVPDLFELLGGFINYRRYLGDLFRRQVQLRPIVVAHSFAHHSPMRLREEKMARVRRAKESTRHSAGDEDKDKTDD